MVVHPEVLVILEHTRFYRPFLKQEWFIPARLNEMKVRPVGRLHNRLSVVEDINQEKNKVYIHVYHPDHHEVILGRVIITIVDMDMI